MMSRMSHAAALGDRAPASRHRTVELEQVGDVLPPAIFSMYTQGPGSNIVPRGLSAMTARALGLPSGQARALERVDGDVDLGRIAVADLSPLKSIGASSFSPSPMTTTPSIATRLEDVRASRRRRPGRRPPCRPCRSRRAEASAAASVTRTSSSARLRSGRVGPSRGMRGPKWCLVACALARARKIASRTPTTISDRRRAANPVPAVLHAIAPDGLAGALDDPVVDDQPERDDRGHRRHLAARPRRACGR